MMQPKEFESSAGLLPHFNAPKRLPLAMSELEDLYLLSDWRVALLDERIPIKYYRYSTVSLFKALALPYLIPIPSVRALARELAERETLQTLCGFLPQQTPSRAGFWHFRRKHDDVYSDLMLRVLIALVLSGSEPNFSLPFVSSIPPGAVVPQGRHSKILLDRYRPPIDVWTATPEGMIDSPMITTGKTWEELRLTMHELEVCERRESLRRKGLAARVALPAEVQTKLYDGHTVRFGIDKPEWLDSRRGGTDTLTTVGPASLRPYTACNVLVVRQHEDRQQILLSCRLAGYGKGTYGLPGGKLQRDESVQDCAARELWEETGLRIRASQPVSWFLTRLPGKPRVLSVGVLVRDFEGDLRHREPNQNTKWQWFDLDKLPELLFEPTRIAIAHFKNDTYPSLQWSDLEARVSESSEAPRQLELPI